jgi:uncharacterized protein involved in exopolysaccharide biosynthesis
VQGKASDQMLISVEPSGRLGKADGPDDGALSGYLTVTEISRFIWEYRVSVALTSALPMLLAIIYLLVTPLVYTAKLQLLLDPRAPQPLRENADSGSATFDSPYIESQVAVIRSEGVSLTVARDLRLLYDDEFVGSLKLAPDAVPGTNADGRDFERNRAAIGALGRGLEVQRLGLSYAIDISFTSRNPDKASKIANAFADAFARDQIASRQEMIKAGGQWLERRLDELRKQMNVAALNVQKFKLKRDYRLPDQNQPGFREDASPANDTSTATSLEELESTSQTYRRLYESYLQAYTEALQKQSLPVANARVITPATRPLSPSAPKKGLILALAMLVGLLAGGGQALVRQHLFSAR